jgi:anti-anti-sigma factor
VVRDSFEIRDFIDPDGVRRVMLMGEADLGAAERLRAGLAARGRRGAPMRLDLSQLAFIDCCGLRAVLSAVEDGRLAGCEVEVERAMSRSVARMIDFARVGSVLWPQELAAAPALA